MQKGSAKTLANPLQERKRQDSNLRTALGRSTVFEAASFSHSDTLPVILLGLCPKLSQFPHPPFQGGDQGLRAFHRRLPSPLASSGPASDDALLFYWDSVPNYLNPPNPLFKGAHQASVRTRARGHRFAVLRPASDDALFNPPHPPFQGGDQGLRAFHRRNGFPCPPASARHLMMPWFPKEFR